MIKYAIITDRFELSFSESVPIPSFSADEIFTMFLESTDGNGANIETFDTLEGAREEFDKFYKNYGSTRFQTGWASQLLTGEVAYLQEYEADDETGEWIDGGDILAKSAEAYNNA